MHKSRKLLSLDLVCLAGCIGASFALWSSYLRFNLPVAANVDERTGLEVLSRFHTSGMNPHFFLYPTLYYYVTYFVTRPWSFSNVLLHGRMLNMACVGLTGWIAYMFCARHFRSRGAGLLAALAVVTSPMIALSGSYLCTDVFLAAGSLASIYFLTGYFTDGNMKSWTAGMVLLGIAVGCKYTAFLLFVAYVLQEAVLMFREKQQSTGGYISRRLLTVLFCSAGAVLLLAAIAFPTHAALDFVARMRNNANGRPISSYLPFFHSLRLKLGAGGALLLTIAALVLLVNKVYLAFAPTRLYKGLAIVLGMVVATTPYSVITPKKFIMDIGSLAKLNLVVVGGAQQWHNYWTWFSQSEALVFGLLAAAGLLLATREWRRFGLSLIYVLLYFVVIGTSHKGYPRYLTAILPLLYCFAGLAAVRLATFAVSGRKFAVPLEYAAIACLAVLSIYNTTAHVKEARELAAAHDEFWTSYMAVLKMRPARIYTLGDAPGAELSNVGFSVRELPLAAGKDPVTISSIRCDELLIEEGHYADPITLSQTTVSEIVDARGEYGQKVFEQHNCK